MYFNHSSHVNLSLLYKLDMKGYLLSNLICKLYGNHAFFFSFIIKVVNFLNFDPIIIFLYLLKFNFGIYSLKVIFYLYFYNHPYILHKMSNQIIIFLYLYKVGFCIFYS